MITFAVFSDTHSNSFVGLAPDGGFHHEGGHHQPTPRQRYKSRQFKQMAVAVEQLAEAWKSPPVVVLNGDACDLHPKTTALITTDQPTMLRLTRQAIEPMVSIADEFYMTIGTKSHTGHFEHTIAEAVGAVPDNPDAGMFAHVNLKLEHEGYRIWAQHHGRMGGLYHTERNAANVLAASMKAETHGERPPNLVIASHQHRWSDSWDNYIEDDIRAIFLPGWQDPTGYINALKRNARAQIGGFMCVIADGQIVPGTERKFRVRTPAVGTIKVGG